MTRWVQTRLGKTSASNPDVNTRMTRIPMDQSWRSRPERCWICFWISSVRANMEGWVLRSSLDSDIATPVACTEFPLLEHCSLEFVQQGRQRAERKRRQVVTFVISGKFGHNL